MDENIGKMTRLKTEDKIIIPAIEKSQEQLNEFLSNININVFGTISLNSKVQLFQKLSKLEAEQVVIKGILRKFQIYLENLKSKRKGSADKENVNNANQSLYQFVKYWEGALDIQKNGFSFYDMPKFEKFYPKKNAKNVFQEPKVGKKSLLEVISESPEKKLNPSPQKSNSKKIGNQEDEDLAQEERIDKMVFELTNPPQEEDVLNFESILSSTRQKKNHPKKDEFSSMENSLDDSLNSEGDLEDDVKWANLMQEQVNSFNTLADEVSGKKKIQFFHKNFNTFRHSFRSIWRRHRPWDRLSCYTQRS